MFDKVEVTLVLRLIFLAIILPQSHLLMIILIDAREWIDS